MRWLVHEELAIDQTPSSQMGQQHYPNEVQHNSSGQKLAHNKVTTKYHNSTDSALNQHTLITFLLDLTCCLAKICTNIRKRSTGMKQDLCYGEHPRSLPMNAMAFQE